MDTTLTLARQHPAPRDRDHGSRSTATDVFAQALATLAAAGIAFEVLFETEPLGRVA